MEIKRESLDDELRKEKIPERGRSVTIHNYWIRHTQKASGEVFNKEATGISLSNISPGGVIRAQERGATIKASPHGVKGYKSTSERTQETFDALMRGYKKSNPDVPIRDRVRIKQELVAPSGTPEFLKEYNEKWAANKTRLLTEGISAGKYPNVEFGKLTPDQQEEIAEEAEEPVIREWIDNPDSNMAKSFPPRLQAARFASLFRRHNNMAKRLNDGSEVDLVHNTHKTATEPFLASGVLIRRSDGRHIKKLEDIGGSLKILNQWESVIHIDEKGNENISIIIRGEEFALDRNAFEELATKRTN